MELGEFHLRALSNMLWLDASTHRSFDNCKWVLLPTKEDLAAVVAFDSSRVGNTRASSNYLESLPNKIWSYHLVSFKREFDMILRQGNDPGSYKAHQYPFESLGLLQSHVHPFHVVFNAGEKVHHILDPEWNTNSDYELPQQYATSLHQCETLYRSWLGSLLESSESHSDQSPSFPSLHWDSPDDWVAGVQASVGEDPQLGGTERARQALVEYSREVGSLPPCGSWEEWIPEYELV
ncbi:hypothetical protein ACGC1H_000095 [Rhizoctonia solani]